MNRIAVGIEYDGSAFAGWQSQQSVRTVQQVLEKALGAIAAEPVSLVAAGRTDAGVHARAQVAHFDTHAERSARSWILGANTEAPADVAVSWVLPVPAHFHARYSATARVYRYLVLNRTGRSALHAARAAWVTRALDANAMAEAAALLVGEHDFSAFRSSECQAKSPVRRLTHLSVERRGDWIVIEAVANAFLHHMMRNIAGLLIAVGKGDEPPGWARTVLEGRDRTRSAATAPAAGLYLWEVLYPTAFGLPAPAPEGPPGADQL
ncbi:MAG TPA: tRNA pseudouridine(38-40) synthase TruA [Steroidobacteraceae bacterium]|nr:tRNA pseudouridine(38-40) synthase TruA [Steroidobacteraceae bacterium]